MPEATGSAGVIRAAHVSLVVADLERSLRFYGDGLGFREIGRFQLGSEVGPICQLEGDVRFEAVIISRDNLTIELAHWLTPGVEPSIPRNANDTGFSQLAIVVGDIDQAMVALKDLGGTVITTTRSQLEMAEVIMTRDPDGTFIELMKLSGE